MLRSTPFNVQADYSEEVGARGAAWYYPHEIPTSQHKEQHDLLLWLPACRWLLHEGVKALRAW